MGGSASAASSGATALRGIAASWLCTGEVGHRPLQRGALVLDADARIVAVGPEAALREANPAACWEQHDAVLLPGLVNAHVHLELCRLRGEAPGGAGFVPWVRGMLAARQRLAPEADQEAIEAGVSELLSAGTVAIGEVTNSLAAVPKLAGLPLIGRVFHEIFGVGRAQAQAALQAARTMRADYGAWPANLSYVLAPHTPYTLPSEVVAHLARDAREGGDLTTIHVAEHPAERAYLAGGDGPFAALLEALGAVRDWDVPATDAVRYLEGLALLGPQLLLVHLADARADEIQRVVEARAPVVLCPRSNLHIQVKLPPLKTMLDAGLTPALGSDSLASSPSLDVLADAVTLRERFPFVQPRALLAMATSYGAQALKLDHQVGRLAVGLQPGVLAFPCSRMLSGDPEAFVLEQVRLHSDARRVLAPGPRHLEPRMAAVGEMREVVG